MTATDDYSRVWQSEWIRPAPEDYVIQDLCWDFQCEEAALFAGGERGHCDCPCHTLPTKDVASFAAGLRGEPR